MEIVAENSTQVAGADVIERLHLVEELRLAEQKSQMLRLRLVANADSQPTPVRSRIVTDKGIRQRVFAVIGHSRVGSVNTQHLRSLMREVVTWIPDFPAFSSLCTEGMHKAWLHDRDAAVRTARTTREQWIRLFRYFANLNRIDADIHIRAINKSGYYVCELAPRHKEDALWREFFHLGKQLGATPGELNRIKAQVEARVVASSGTEIAPPKKSQTKDIKQPGRGKATQ